VLTTAVIELGDEECPLVVDGVGQTPETGHHLRPIHEDGVVSAAVTGMYPQRLGHDRSRSPACHVAIVGEEPLADLVLLG
jgi:hypothetical protein